jgi:hypothetical protein
LDADKGVNIPRRLTGKAANGQIASKDPNCSPRQKQKAAQTTLNVGVTLDEALEDAASQIRATISGKPLVGAGAARVRYDSPSYQVAPDIRLA